MSGQPFANDFFGFPGHNTGSNGDHQQAMAGDDQAMAAAVAASAGSQGPMQMGQMPGQMPQIPQMPTISQMPQMQHMQHMQQMQQLQQQMQQIQQMQQMPTTGQSPEDDMMAYLNNAPFYDSFADMSGMLDTRPAAPSGAPPPPPSPGPLSMFPPSLPPSFTASHSNPGPADAADDILDKDAEMLDMGTGGAGPGGANEPGGGPQPAEEFIQAASATAVAAAGSGSATAAASQQASALTEFTRRKNWPAKLVEEIRDMLLILDNNQRIRYASPSVETILGHSATRAVGLSLDELVHRDDRAVFLAELNSSIANATPLRMHLRLRKGNYKPKPTSPSNASGAYNFNGASEANGGGANGANANGANSANGANGATNGHADDNNAADDNSPAGTETYCIVEAVGHAHIASARYATNPSNLSPFCQAFFLMARPYPTKNGCLLDSFLEHKMENERLRRRIDDLRREEESEGRDDESQTQSQSQSFTPTQSQGHTQLWRQSLDGRSDMGASDNGVSAAVSGATGGSAAMFFRAGMGGPGGMSMPPPPMGGLNMGAAGLPAGLAGMTSMSSKDISNMLAQNPALTRENLEGISAHKPDSLLDKMMRYNDGKTSTAAADGGGGGASSSVAGSATTAAANGKRAGAAAAGGPSVANTISLLTGLYYAEGERSKGLSTGNRSPRLIQGDAGIAISAHRADRGSASGGGAGGFGASEKKKKLRVADEYVCNDCGTLDSPEWRKGPGGPKTLCNACGLRWAKKEKKEKRKVAAVGEAPPGAMGGGGGMV